MKNLIWPVIGAVLVVSSLASQQPQQQQTEEQQAEERLALYRQCSNESTLLLINWTDRIVAMRGKSPSDDFLIASMAQKQKILKVCRGIGRTEETLRTIP